MNGAGESAMSTYVSGTTTAGAPSATFHEGSIASPIVFTVGTPHSGSVGGATGDDSSFYKFTVSSTGQHTIAISGMSVAMDLEIDLWSNSSIHIFRLC